MPRGIIQPWAGGLGWLSHDGQGGRSATSILYQHSGSLLSPCAVNSLSSDYIWLFLYVSDVL